MPVLSSPAALPRRAVHRSSQTRSARLQPRAESADALWGGMESIRERRRAWALLGLIVAGAVAVKLTAWPVPVGHHALDGSNYYQVAGHVAAGDGLQTRLSLYHQGFRTFPHASNIYPAWPLLLGHVSRAAGLESAAVALPIALYGLSIVLLYGLTNRLGRALGTERLRWRGAPAVDVGHVAALLFALNPVFFRHTSLPYAEGLVYASTFGALLALDATRTARAAWRWALAAGALGAVAFLARPQMLPLPLAIVAGLLVTAQDRRDLGAALAAGFASAALICGWAWHLTGLVDAFSPSMLVDYAAYRETPTLAPFPITRSAPSWPAFVTDRVAGLAVAFDPLHPNGYARSFGAAVYLPPLAFVPLGLRAPTVGEAFAWLRRPTSRTFVATALAGAGALLAVHLHHGTLIWEWWFHWRHGLPLILPLALALVVLFTSTPAWIRGVATALIAWTVFTSALGVRHTTDFLRRATHGPSAPEAALVAWADAQPEPPSFVTTKAQALAAFSERAGFHWTVCGDDPAQTKVLLEDAGADYLLLYPGEERCPGVAALLPSFRTVGTFGPLRVLAPRSPALAQAG